MQLVINFDAFTHARRSDPITSHLAAKKVEKFAKGHAATILQCLKDHGAQTADEIAKRTPLNAVQVNRRLGEMGRSGWIRTTGNLRASASGCLEREWESV